MKRLTKKRQDGSYVCINGEFHNIGEHINKLGELEDIEQELGIDLITLFKTINQKKLKSFFIRCILFNLSKKSK